jgi:predicted kinase
VFALLTLPVHCLHCRNAVTLEYRPHEDDRTLEFENEFVCPHCSAHVSIRLPGRLSDWWAGHTEDPAGRTRPLLIALAGLPGVGKTTIARGLARDLSGVHIRIDAIEIAIRESGVTVVSLDDAGYRVAYAIAEENLRLGRTVIADSVNPIPITRDAWRDVAKRAASRFIELEIGCSDATEHRRRVEERLGKPAAESGPTWEEVVSRDYHAWSRDHVFVDTAGTPADQMAGLAIKAMGLTSGS